MLVLPEVGATIITRDSSVDNNPNNFHHQQVDEVRNQQRYNVLQKVSASSTGNHNSSNLPPVGTCRRLASNSSGNYYNSCNKNGRGSNSKTVFPKIASSSSSSENTAPMSANKIADNTVRNNTHRNHHSNHKNNKKDNNTGNSSDQELLMPSTVRPPLLNQSISNNNSNSNDSMEMDASSSKLPSKPPTANNKQQKETPLPRNSSSVTETKLTPSGKDAYPSGNATTTVDIPPAPIVTVTKKAQDTRLPSLVPTPPASMKNNNGQKCNNGIRVTFTARNDDSQDCSMSPVNNNNGNNHCAPLSTKSEPVTCLASPLPYLMPSKPSQSVARSGNKFNMLAKYRNKQKVVSQSQKQGGYADQSTHQAMPPICNKATSFHEQTQLPENKPSNSTQQVSNNTHHRAVNQNKPITRQALLNPAPQSVLAEFDDQFKRITALYMETYRLLEKC